ncbi:MAG: Fic family protein [Nitrosopumilus sp. H13]|nr:MAG: Fic family protein [Nitrosopumilus sp. H13]
MDAANFPTPNGRFEYNSQQRLTFVPKKLPPAIKYDDNLMMALVRAERKVGELEGICNEIQKPYILIKAHMRKEAVLSSKIEGTLTSLEDFNRHEAVGDIEKTEMEYLRLREVINYVHALDASMVGMDGGDRMSLVLLRKAHKKLLYKVRGEDKSPGMFRDIQNMIVSESGAKKEVIYMPPSAEMVRELLDDLESFFQAENKDVSPLVQCAMIHYQFEAIHPFRDGNGRIGRLILPLLLYERKILTTPLLYLSEYFEEHREEYYAGLMAVSQKSQWYEWIEFFLEAFSEQAERTIKSIKGLQGLREKYKKTLMEKRRSSKAVFLLDHIVSNPYMTIPMAQKILNVTYPTAKTAVTALVDAGILTEVETVMAKRVFMAQEISEIFQS